MYDGLVTIADNCSASLDSATVPRSLAFDDWANVVSSESPSPSAAVWLRSNAVHRGFFNSDYALSASRFDTLPFVEGCGVAWIDGTRTRAGLGSADTPWI